MLTRFKLEIVLALLLLLTLGAIWGERAILATSITITPEDGYSVALYDDDVMGGASQSTLLSPRQFEWRCTLVKQYDWPMCGFELLLDPERQKGLDLSNYDKIKLWLDYEGPTDTIRIYLRNFDQQYSVPTQNDSTKYNQLEFSTAMLGGPVEFDLDYFFVANWWTQRHGIAPELARPDFSNTVVFEVQTGINGIEGEHYFKLNKLEFTGQRLTTVQWYQFIMVCWLVVALVFLIGRVLHLNRELRIRNLREQELLEVNAVLDMRGKILEEMTRTDPLTGAFNRQGIKEAVRAGLNEWRREQKPLSLIMLDIDYFKRINDQHGHAVGDRILMGLVERVQKNTRGADLFARWGGEEFVLVCRNTSGEEAFRIADKLRRIVANSEFEQGLRITASFGLATLGVAESLDQLFARADRALYAAKAQGRNRVVVDEQQAPSPQAKAG